MALPQLKRKDVLVPADVPSEARDIYIDNYLTATKGTGRMMLFAGDQKIEHLNDDFYKPGTITPEDNDPEHLFRIASGSSIGVFAAQLGLISRYGRKYRDVNYLVKLNSKTHLVKGDQADPFSNQLWSVEQVLDLADFGKLKVRGVGYTIYLGSEFESEMLQQAAQIVMDAHAAGLLVVFWIYPRGKAVKDEADPHLIAGGCGVAACLGADFVKVNYPKSKDELQEEAFKEAIVAAGQTGVVCAGGSSTDPREFLDRLEKQIKISGAVGNATGRNIHQKPLEEAVNMCNAISAITLGGADIEEALQVYEGKAEFKL